MLGPGSLEGFGGDYTIKPMANPKALRNIIANYSGCDGHLGQVRVKDSGQDAWDSNRDKP